jgi:hypothetical protein
VYSLKGRFSFMRHKKIVPFLCLAGTLLLVACGFHQGDSSSTGSNAVASTATSSIATQAIRPSERVTVILDKTSYTPDEAITVTIRNGLKTSIIAANHQSGCTLVTLQWQDAQGNWQNQNKCRLGVMTRLITLPSQSSQVQSLSPTSGTFARSGQWAKGHYRIIFGFTLGNAADVESISITKVPGSPIYSPTFSIM